jgi:hypothetical protein
MASTISAGTTSGTAIAIAGDTTGALALQTNNGTTAVTIDTSQNVGIGTSSPSISDFNASSGVLHGYKNSSAGFFFKAESSNTVSVYGVGSDTAYLYTISNDPLLFGTNSTERMRLNSTGALVLAGGTTTANGIGITFPATQSASSDANTLDDYEEGTWTPTISGSITNPTVTYPTRFGYYTKVGRVVTIQCAIQPGTTSVAGSGDLRFTGLPFASANLSDVYGVGVAGTNGNFSWGASKTQLVFNVAPNSTTITPRAMQNGVAEAAIPVGNFDTDSKYLFFSLTYIAA